MFSELRNYRGRRTALYIALGVAPALAMLPLALIAGRFPLAGTLLLSPAFLAALGFIGLCLAAYASPVRVSMPMAVFVSLLLLAGLAPTGALLYALLLHIARGQFVLSRDTLTAMLLCLPTALAVHYLSQTLKAWIGKKTHP